ncbi:MAG: metallophosphoesterase [Bacteroidia bacterium]|nr:metallophosphoesterase [Bacteroidia bacterium]
MVKRIGALATSRGAAFVQFTGDLIDGYLTSADQQRLQYANFKRALEPYWGSIPFICAPGNHEAHSRLFYDTQGQTYYSIDRYPYADSSAEALFASEFANPISSLRSEDGAAYDPDPTVQNFPPYGETVFTYSYGNTAMVVLNSNYWYTVQQRHVPHVSGNIHAYIMDNQLAWLAHQLDSLERDPAIAHVFVTCHTPIFPNGGHVQDDMWYRGDNRPRPYVAGKPVAKGILERRDEILDLLVNKSTKVRATLTGDEHNYCRTQITEAMPRYPEGWTGPRLALKRTIWQINNGSAGAPYYAQEQTPWSAFTQAFTTQVALVFVHVNGDKLEVEVQNPDTLEVIDRFTLR